MNDFILNLGQDDQLLNQSGRSLVERRIANHPIT